MTKQERFEHFKLFVKTHSHLIDLEHKDDYEDWFECWEHGYAAGLNNKDSKGDLNDKRK